MNKKEATHLLEDIFRQIAPEINFSQINLQKPLRNQVELDSFDFYRIVVEISKSTNIFIPDSKISGFKNLDEFLDFITELSVPHQQPMNDH